MGRNTKTKIPDIRKQTSDKAEQPKEGNNTIWKKEKGGLRQQK